MQARQEVLRKDYYYCWGCGQWFQETTPMQVDWVDPGDLPEEGIKLDDVPVSTRTLCHDKPPCYLDPDGDWYDAYSQGSEVWICGSCNQWHTDEQEAVSCCR